MSILKISAITNAPKNRIMGLFDYMTAPSKTENGFYIGGHACSPKRAYEEMNLVKLTRRKTDGRQYIPYVVSITPDDPATPNEKYMEVGAKIAILHPDFQCCYSLHLDSAVRHLHFLMNSVSYRDGSKFTQSHSDLGRFRQQVNDILLRAGFDIIQQKTILQQDMTEKVLQSDFSFWETEQPSSPVVQDRLTMPIVPSPHDFFQPSSSSYNDSEYHNPDDPRYYPTSNYFDFERSARIMSEIAPVSDLFPTELSTPEIRQSPSALMPTVSFNLNSSFTLSPEQLAATQSVIEQEQLNRAGTFALEFQRLAQEKGVAVNMEFNINNDFRAIDDTK